MSGASSRLPDFFLPIFSYLCVVVAGCDDDTAGRGAALCGRDKRSSGLEAAGVEGATGEEAEGNVPPSSMVVGMVLWYVLVYMRCDAGGKEVCVDVCVDDDDHHHHVMLDLAPKRQASRHTTKTSPAWEDCL